MAECQTCHKDRIVNVGCKHSDMFWTKSAKFADYDGYSPEDMGITSGDYGDYLDFAYCLNCGQIQGRWPLPETWLEKGQKGDRP